MASLLSLEDLVVSARFLGRLPGLLRHPITVEAARAMLRQRLERREADFLDLARRTIYVDSAGPYRSLLRQAGCEYGDLVRLVNQNGVESTLLTLLRHGVYLTVDELKGRRPVIRGNCTFTVAPGQLRNPFVRTHLWSQTGGSRGIGTSVVLDLTFIREMAVNNGLVAAARGEGDWAHAVWLVPGGDAMVKLLRYAASGAVPVRWFSQLDLRARGLHPRYRWSARLLQWGSRMAGVRFPRPEHVSLHAPLPIAQWMAELLRERRTPHLITMASSAVRVCQAAMEAGFDLSAAQFTLTGEPTTPSRLAVIRKAGAQAQPFYATVEAGLIGLGCLAPAAPDDVHLFHDRLAVISAGVAGDLGLPANALFVSSLRVTGSPVILLNVSLGDQAVMTSRPCGCALESLGWPTHLDTIRSYEKLTAGGMTFLDTDLIRVLEEVLPGRFGGGPTDYQLVEEESADGQPRLRLLVHPAVGQFDGEAVAGTFLAAIGSGSGAERVMMLAWREGKVLRVEHHPPLATASGKILHLHVTRQPDRIPSGMEP
jgi:hypothetical protein